MNTNFHAAGKSISLVTTKGTFAVNSGSIIAIYPDGSDCIVRVRKPFGAERYNISGVTAATLAANDSCFLLVTPVDKDDVVGTAFYINTGIYTRFSANTVTSRTNANAIIYYNEAFKEEVVYVTATYAALLAATVDPGQPGLTIQTVTAFAGGGQGSATALTGEFCNVTNVASALDSVKLTNGKGDIIVANNGNNLLAIYPATGGVIDGKAANGYVELARGSVARFVEISSGVWESNVDRTITLNAPTSGKGGIKIQAVDNVGDTITTVTTASQSASCTWTFPDTNGNAEPVMTAAAQTITGAKTFSAEIVANAGIRDSGLSSRYMHYPLGLQENLNVNATAALTSYLTTVENNAVAGPRAITIPPGTIQGQPKKIKAIDVTNGSVVLTGTFTGGNTTITMADAGDYAILQWTGSLWTVLELGNDADGVTAPVLS